MRSHAGFTLIEALVVVALVAVLAGVAVPVVAGALTRYNLTSANQQVASTIRSARFQAVGRNQALEVRFDFPAAGQYQIVDTAGNTVGQVQILPSGVTFSGDPADISIEISGRMPTCPVAGCTVTITNGDATQDGVITVSRAGRVQLQ